MVLLSVDFSNLHTILESLYNEMMPLCGDMLDVAKGLAGLGALFYVVDDALSIQRLENGNWPNRLTCIRFCARLR